MTNSNFTKLRLFVACPNDLLDEVNIVKEVIQELNLGVAQDKQIFLELIRWETHAYPSIGEDAQDVLNKQLPMSDIFIGILWSRFGTPTKRSESGTKEEFDRAYHNYKACNWPEIMFYFCTNSVSLTTPTEAEQYKKVLLFKSSLVKSGFLYWEYKALEQFKRDLNGHLTKLILKHKIWPRTNTDEQKISTSIENVEDLTLFLGKLDSFLNTNIHITSIVYLDIDDLGIYNENNGREKGDIVIREINNCLKTIIEHKGYSYRVSGDEFAIILPNHSRNEATATAGRIVNEIRKSSDIDLSVSIGICATDNRIKESEDLVEFARQAVYISKQTGKDRITHYPFNEKQEKLLIINYDGWEVS